MKKLQFQVDINAPQEKVWNTLWDDATYPQWASAFGEGSRAESDWQQGSKILFLGDKDSGMFSLIAEKRPYQYMSFKHLGEVKDGVEQPESDWAGSMENYSLEDRAGVTTLEVEIDVTPEFETYFSETFPKALKKVKEIAEG